MFIFAAEHHGGHGLCRRGVVIDVAGGVGSRVSVTVRPMGAATQSLGRAELRLFRDRPEEAPRPELDHKLYRQATNKIAGISEAAASFLRGFF